MKRINNPLINEKILMERRENKFNYIIESLIGLLFILFLLMYLGFVLKMVRIMGDEIIERGNEVERLENLMNFRNKCERSYGCGLDYEYIKETNQMVCSENSENGRVLLVERWENGVRYNVYTKE